MSTYLPSQFDEAVEVGESKTVPADPCMSSLHHRPPAQFGEAKYRETSLKEFWTQLLCTGTCTQALTAARKFSEAKITFLIYSSQRSMEYDAFK